MTRITIKKSIGDAAESVRRAIIFPKKRKKEIVDFLTSGSTNLNLALSGKANGGWARGRVLNLVGDGSSGKTLLALEFAAHCFYFIKNVKARNFPTVKRLFIVYDNVEGVMDFDVESMYGKEFFDAIIWRRSRSAEEFGRRVARWIMKMKTGDSLIYIVDSLDSLVSSASKKRFLEAAESDVDEKGAYKGAEKAAYFSQSFFGNLCNLIEDEKKKVKKDATILIISQVRKKIGITFGKSEYRTGGAGMDFYTHQVMWLSEAERLAKTIEGDKRVYGIRVRGKVDRSKVAKPYRETECQIIYDRGIDDIKGMIDYLFGKKQKSVRYKWDNQKFARLESLVKYIEQNNQEERLKEMCQRKWESVEEKLVEPLLKRKQRFPGK